MDDKNDEKCIYQNALRRIVELDSKLNESILQTGYITGNEGSRFFSEAISIARSAISEGAMRCARSRV